MAKIELGFVWAFSLLTLLTKSDVMFFASVFTSVVVTIRNFPGACKVVKSLIDKIKGDA